MPDLAELVRDEFHTQAATVEAPDDLDGRTYGRITQRAQRRRVAAGAALAALVVVAVAGVVALQRYGALHARVGRVPRHGPRLRRHAH